MNNEELNKLMAEKVIWKPVPDYGGLYEVSNFGEARSTFDGKKHTRVQSKNRQGYCRVGLYKDGKQTAFSIARLVLVAFVGVPQDGQEASHIDGNKTNNHADNLKWETHAENMNRTIEHGTITYGEKSNLSKLKELEVHEIRRLNSLGINNRVLSKMFLVIPYTISRICSRRTWKYI